MEFRATGVSPQTSLRASSTTVASFTGTMGRLPGRVVMVNPQPVATAPARMERSTFRAASR